MKTRTMACALLVGACSAVNAQNWVLTGNQVTQANQYLGCNVNSTQPLRLTTVPNFPIELRTFNLQRARLNGNVTGPIGPTPALEFPNINRDGFFLLSGTANAFTNGLSRAPFTRLHLVDNAVNPNDPVVYAQQHGFRPWQRNGITFTGNSDQSYIGHKYDVNDNTDFVVQWSDNPNGSPWGTDRMKFVFTTQYDPIAARGAATVGGLEALRLWPRNNSEVNVGIGDFAPPAVGDPTERVDVLNGRVRVRELPDDINQAQGPFRVVVADHSAAPSSERGVLKWRDPNQLDCKWTLTNNLWNHVYTAVGPPGLPCPDDLDAVGVGIDLAANPAPAAKFTVNTSVFDEGASILQSHPDANVYGLRIDARGGTQNNYGARILATANNTAVHNYGLFSEAFGSTPRSRAVSARTNGATFTAYCGEFLAYDAASWTHGVTGRAYGGSSRHGVEGLAFAGAAGGGAWGSATELFGLNGRADGGGASPVGYGVYGTATGSSVNWAGYFAGDVQAGATYLPSDADLKTLIEEDVDAVASDVLDGLRPRAYVYNTEAYPSMRLSEGQQYGLLAQEVEVLLPGLVKESVHPAHADEEGNIISEAVHFKAVNYVGLIPYLITGHQAQQREMESLRAAMQELREQLAACCANPSSDQRLAPSTGNAATDELLLGQERLLRIAPNPFTDRTTLYYTTERNGRVQLLANSADGRDLRILSEAQREAGAYQFEWSTDNLAPGVYYVTLLLDGEPLVKRAVKVGR